MLESFGTRLVSATGDPIPCCGKYEVQFKMGKDEITNKVIAADIRYSKFYDRALLRKCVYGLREKRSLVLGLVVVMMIALVDCVNAGREGTSQFRIYSPR